MAPPSSRPGSSARPGSAGVPYHHHHNQQHHGANGKPAIVTTAAAASAAKGPGTPRREQSHRLEKAVAVQDPGLKDYVGWDFASFFFLRGLFPLSTWPPFPPPIPAPFLSSEGCLFFFFFLVDGWLVSARPVPTYMAACPYRAYMHLRFVRRLGGRPRGFFVWMKRWAAGAGSGSCWVDEIWRITSAAGERAPLPTSALPPWLRPARFVRSET
jgi:hypothetical protein